ncbi:sodium- and chloride-dependent neutral and basic amino acid transporter B(0+)-like [Erpetoichthys calabaricus]|uniref:sodium- and chloride-dependent neutral and basic amino acid transporter B(0+)-like n=1 Tax=Erpetoichthys calabaricus TaxID=27687 RepID=UPI002234E3AB|nr:sodium- and chloride-dependent neutral and basic amino acid transporter B(0+)-like [Erpetoichthys calabaricus]
MDDNTLMKYSMDLKIALTDSKNNESDIDPHALCSEIRMFANLVPSNSTAMQALEYLYEKELATAMPNVAATLRIPLTVPITVCSAERSFSKLKLIKNYLRSSMSYERLNSLALISIEQEIVESLDYSELIHEFASAKPQGEQTSPTWCQSQDLVNREGAFLIPYTIMLAFVGLPLFFLECSFGQFASLGPVSVWKAVPIMQGVGVTMVLVSTLVATYYNCIIGYSIYYLFASFQFPLPWSDCFEWSDENCSKQPKEYCNITSANGSFVLVNSTWLNDNNATCEGSNIFSISVQSPSEQYWDKVALRRSSGLDESGGVIWHLALCLLLAWIIVGAALFKGIKSSGKLVYFTAIFPYVVLIILLIRGVTLEGAREGIEYYIGTHSDISKLSDAEVWKDAATQIFFSLGTACGGLVALSSYNKFNNNCYSDAIVVCVTNCATSVFAGFAIFSVLGHIAYISHKPVSEVAQSGFGLAFIVYPEALSKLPISPLWSILFFFMLLTLGIDSQFALIETITTALQDEFPKYLRSRRALITVVVCVVLYLLGLPCVTGAGIYWVNLIDHFCSGWVCLIAAVLELVGIIYIYGGNRFIKDIEMMIGKKNCYFWLWWRACWFFFSPCLLTVSTAFEFHFNIEKFITLEM